MKEDTDLPEVLEALIWSIAAYVALVLLAIAPALVIGAWRWAL